MTKNHQYNDPHTAVCEVHLEQIEQGIGNLRGYQRALVVFRLRKSVVGQAWLPVTNGHIAAATLRTQLPSMAWAVWQLLMDEGSQPTPVPTATVVVCTRDRTDDLANCLPGLQHIAAQGNEVIVVDSCPSDDRTAQLVSAYPELRYLRDPIPAL